MSVKINVEKPLLCEETAQVNFGFHKNDGSAMPS